MMQTEISRIFLKNPVSGLDVPALKVINGAGLEATLLPGRTLDMYELRFQDTPISFTDREADISTASRHGTESFLKHFFAGFYTTCGLIQSGRPCEENGRSYGLHGNIANTEAENVAKRHEEGFAEVCAEIHERHPEGEHLCLRRSLRIEDDRAAFVLTDEVTNLSERETPFMMMYHMNFGAPFLSERLDIQASFSYIENRDTQQAATIKELFHIGAEGSEEKETVYYTQLSPARVVRLYQPALGMGCQLSFLGDDLTWMGVWKNFLQGHYALGIEPGNCPGLGRVNARKRGLLPILKSKESRKHAIRAEFFFG